ncbi:MAG: (2Fe-2S)-binding protein [Bacteroidetes bacterium]|nr:(2Fe-2S)-binding protein [Bacteroidota bacterium]
MSLVCFCQSVGEQEVVAAILRGASSVEMLGHFTLAGTGCHSCHPDLERLLRLNRVKKDPDQDTQLSLNFPG